MILLPKRYWEIKQTKDKGRGIFAKKDIPKGVVLGDYLGRVVRTKDFDFKLDHQNLYLMYYHDQASIYPDLTKPGIYLLNHSCNPNSWLYTYGHTLAFTIKDITAGEELTISYLLPPKGKEKSCIHICKCERNNCTKSMHLTEEKYKMWRSFQDKNSHTFKPSRTRIKYGSNLKPLPSYPKKIPLNPIYKIIAT